MEVSYTKVTGKVEYNANCFSTTYKRIRRDYLPLSVCVRCALCAGKVPNDSDISFQLSYLEWNEKTITKRKK